MRHLECPACRKRVSFLQFVKPLMPINLVCNSCGERLRIAKHNNTITASKFALGVIAGASLAPKGTLLAIGGLAVSALALEFIIYLFSVKIGLTTESSEK